MQPFESKFSKNPEPPLPYANGTPTPNLGKEAIGNEENFPVQVFLCDTRHYQLV